MFDSDTSKNFESYFNPHGHFSMRLSGRVFCVKLSGAWNLETMKLYAKEGFRHTSSILGEPWVMLTELSDWELATKECEPIHIRLFNDSVKNGLCRLAVVNNSGVIKMEQFNVAFRDHPDFKRQFFDNETAAIKWLEQEGFPLA